MLNVFCLAGRLQDDPVIRETPGGIRMAEITLDVERPFANSQGLYEKDRITLEIWRGLADTIGSVCRKGSW